MPTIPTRAAVRELLTRSGFREAYELRNKAGITTGFQVHGDDAEGVWVTHYVSYADPRPDTHEALGRDKKALYGIALAEHFRVEIVGDSLRITARQP